MYTHTHTHTLHAHTYTHNLHACTHTHTHTRTRTHTRWTERQNPEHSRHGLVYGLYAVSHGELVHNFLTWFIKVNLPCLILLDVNKKGTKSDRCVATPCHNFIKVGWGLHLLFSLSPAAILTSFDHCFCHTPPTPNPEAQTRKWPVIPTDGSEKCTLSA